MERIEASWKQAPIVWLSGVRRVGKTTIAQSLGQERIFYVNCDLPVTEDIVRDPELFFGNCRRPIIVFDEIHQLRDPARVLKIGADLFPHIKILATGSSTLAASRKFKDTLTGRKRIVHLTPVTLDELSAFDNVSLQDRLFRGGLPPALLAGSKPSAFYREWMDSFFARDIQKLFAFRNPDKFNNLFEYVIKQSGGILDVSSASSALSISRPTVQKHLQALQITHAITLLRPFHGSGQKELVKAPKIYAFDTGFVSFCRGWDPLRSDDYGILWEHIVLEYLQAHGQPDVRYWRDAAGREIDFVLTRNRDTIDVMECKWDSSRFDSTAVRVFRQSYPNGMNYVLSPQTAPKYTRRIVSLEFQFCNPLSLFLGIP
ncbi:MAG: ATP-binding protein [Verrucomicrobiota bacterium]